MPYSNWRAIAMRWTGLVLKNRASFRHVNTRCLIVAGTQTAHAACSHPAWQNYSPGAGRVTSTSPIRTGPS